MHVREIPRMSGLRPSYVLIFVFKNKTAVFKKDWSFAMNGFIRNPEIITPITGHRRG
jgi:hypothetical protein